MSLFGKRSLLILVLAVIFGLGSVAPPAAAAGSDLIPLLASAKKKKRKKKKKPRRRPSKKRRRKKGRSRKMTIQPEKEKKKKPAFAEEEEEKLPTGPAKIKLPMVEEKKSAAATLEEQLLEAEIKQLKEIIQTTEGPAKADLLFRLAERYYEKSRAAYFGEMQEYDKAVQKWMEAREKNPNAPEPKINNRGSKVWTKAAMDIYRVILRNYKDYRRRDEVLFTMGYNLYETGEKSEGVKMYWELIKGFPESRFVPDAYLAMGEHYFNANDVFNAKKAYERALKFKTSKVYTFALYKLAWCDYNLGDYDHALEKFKQVVVEAEAERQRGGDKNKIQLKREALQDMILAFSQVDALDVAKEYYNSTVGTRETKEYMRKLAKTYEKQGKAEMTVKSFRMLLDEYPSDPEAPAFHNSIVLAYRKMNAREKVKREVNRLIDQYKPGSQWAETNKSNTMAIKKANALVEESLRDLVTSYHKEAQETKYWDTYNLARGIYAKYLDTFPDSEYAYKLRWYYSDILYKMRDFYGAAHQYAKVVQMDKKKGAFLEEAAYNSVLCWDKCIELRDLKGEDCRKWKPDTGKKKLQKEEARTIKKKKLVFQDKGEMTKEELEKKEIPFFERKFLEAADIFSDVAPKHDMYIPIRFKSAFIFHRYRHFREMARRFGEIIERYPKNEYALKAVRLSLNTMYQVANSKHFSEEERNKNWKEINRWAKAFIGNKVLVNSPAAKKEKFSDEMQSLIEQSGYNVVLAVRQKDPLKAAHGFEKFVKDYPKSKYAHRALYAAVVIFDEAEQLDLAISAGKRLLKNYKESDRYNPTIGFLADFHTRVADFAKAAKYNEMYYDKWLEQTGQGGKKKKKTKKAKRKPKRTKKGEEEPEKILITDKEAMDALYNAALIRESMGQFDKAIGNYVKYIKQFPDAKDVPDIFYKVGKIYERRKDWRKADRVWEGYPDKYSERSDAGRMLNVTYKHAMALRKLGKEKDSDKLLDKIIEQFNQLPEEAKSEEAREAVSHARFLQLEQEFNDYINIKLELPPRNLKKNLFRKIELRPKLERKYEEVVAYKDPDWSIAGLVRIGQISQNLSQSMYDAPIPAGLTPEQADIYVEELQKQALPLEEKAMALYQKAIDVSGQKGLYNQWTIKAQEQLKSYRPSAYPEAYKAGLVSTEYFYERGPHTQKVDVPPPPEPVPLPPSTPAADGLETPDADAS